MLSTAHRSRSYQIRGVGVAVLIGHPLPLGGIGVPGADVFGLKML